VCLSVSVFAVSTATFEWLDILSSLFVPFIIICGPSMFTCFLAHIEIDYNEVVQWLRFFCVCQGKHKNRSVGVEMNFDVGF